MDGSVSVTVDVKLIYFIFLQIAHTFLFFVSVHAAKPNLTAYNIETGKIL